MQKREQIQQVVPKESFPLRFPPPTRYGKVTVKNSQGSIVREFRVPFLQEEVDAIKLFRRGLKEICTSGFYQVPSMLGHAPFPSGNTLLDREKAIVQMQQTAGAIEEVLALNKVFKERDSIHRKDLVSLRRTMHILNSAGVVEEVTAVEGLQQIVDFVYDNYGKQPEHSNSDNNTPGGRRGIA